MTATTKAGVAAMPKSYMTDAQRDALRAQGMTDDDIYLSESEAADDAGDDEASWGWLAKVELPAHTLMFLKRRHGAGFIRELGFNTAGADAVYGAGWLDRAEPSYG
jgi:hypothetical protein